jgi:hypothetical protein
MRTTRAFAALGALGALALPCQARADRLVIKDPDAHPSYRAELEPHGILAIWHRSFGPYKGGKVFKNPEFGAGFRATIELGDPAFVPSINDTVGISFGIETTSCAPAGCDLHVFFPVAMQWNFFLSENWSVMGEPGLAVHQFFGLDPYADFYFAGGGRFHFNDDVSLTMRIGYPIGFTIGASFFVGE